MTQPARNAHDLSIVFDAYRPILKPYIPNMMVVQDNERGVYLNTQSVMKNRQPLFFASLAINKAYVSFHLFPVYVSGSAGWHRRSGEADAGQKLFQLSQGRSEPGGTDARAGRSRLPAVQGRRRYLTSLWLALPQGNEWAVGPVDRIGGRQRHRGDAVIDTGMFIAPARVDVPDLARGVSANNHEIIG